MQPLTDEQSRLAAQHMYVADIAARRFYRRVKGKPITFEDVVAAARVGLVHAAASFDPALGYKFTTHAYRRCRGQIIDDLRLMLRDDGCTRGRLNNHRTASQAADDFYKANGRKATPGEMRAMVGDNGCLPSRFSIYRPTDSNHYLNDGESTREENRNKEMIAPGDHVADADAKDAFDALVATVSDRTKRAVLIYYYRDGLTLAEIGRAVGYSEAHISNIRREAIASLRASMPGVHLN